MKAGRQIAREITLEILNEIDRFRSAAANLDEFEEKLLRLLDQASFPSSVASRVEDLPLAIQRLREENLSFGANVDENQGAEEIFQDVTSSLQRYLDE